jgi:hypothetical protein
MLSSRPSRLDGQRTWAAMPAPRNDSAIAGVPR